MDDMIFWDDQWNSESEEIIVNNFCKIIHK